MSLDLNGLIQTTGYIGIFILVYCETGLLIGLVLPGDSLIFSAGLLASKNIFNIGFLIPLIFIAAIAGDNTGYWLGKRFGPKVFKRPEAKLFTPDQIRRAEHFYEKHGGKTLILARYIPVVRTLAPLLAGMGKMPYRRFVGFDVAACAIWATGITLLGFYLGRSIPNIDKYLLPIIALVIIASLAPALWHLAKQPDQRQRLVAAAKGFLKRPNKSGPKI